MEHKIKDAGESVKTEECNELKCVGDEKLPAKVFKNNSNEENRYSTESDLDCEIEKCNKILNSESKIQIPVLDSSSMNNTAYDTDEFNLQLEESLIFLESISSPNVNIDDELNVYSENKVLDEEQLQSINLQSTIVKLDVGNRNTIAIQTADINDYKHETKRIKLDPKEEQLQSTNLQSQLNVNNQNTTDSQIADFNDYKHEAKRIKLDPNFNNDIVILSEVPEAIIEKAVLDSKDEKIKREESNSKETNLNSLKSDVSIILKDNANKSNVQISDKRKSVEKEISRECIKIVDSVDSDVESVIDNEPYETHFVEGDTLILCSEGSDFDSEVEKCAELKDTETAMKVNFDIQNSICNSEKPMSLENDCKTIFTEQTTHNSNSSNNNAKWKEIKSKGSDITIISRDINSKQTSQLDADIMLQNDENSNIDSEIEKCSKLLNQNYSDLEEYKLNDVRKDCQTSDDSLKAKKIICGKNDVELNLVTVTIHQNEITSDLISSEKTPNIISESVNGYTDSKIISENICPKETTLCIQAINSTNSDGNINGKFTNTKVSAKKLNKSLLSKKINTKNIKHESKEITKTIVKNCLKEEKDDTINIKQDTKEVKKTVVKNYLKEEKCDTINIKQDLKEITKTIVKNCLKEEKDDTINIKQDTKEVKKTVVKNYLKEAKCDTINIKHESKEITKTIVKNCLKEEKDDTINIKQDTKEVKKTVVKNYLKEEKCDTINIKQDLKEITKTIVKNCLKEEKDDTINIKQDTKEVKKTVVKNYLKEAKCDTINIKQDSKEITKTIVKNCLKEEKDDTINIKQDSKEIKKIIEKDYLEEEKDDITNPEWQKVKNLSTNEERYQQVRDCWRAPTVPDPNKNLTYHNYKKKFCGGYSEARPIRQHKRHASSNLPERNAKRPCTFFLDKEIDSVKKTKDQRKQEIFNEMHCQISNIDQQIVEIESRWPNRPHQYSVGYNSYDRNNRFHNQFNCRISNIADTYNKIADDCESSFSNKITSLKERRNEILKFYSFYKGLNDSGEDPTLLTESQFQELNEIENIYEQFNHYYKNAKD